MKKISLILTIIILSSFFFNNSFSQNNYNWITPNKTYLKMYVADDGMYRINKNDFTNAGINTAGLDPRTVKVYNKGVQVPIFFNGEQDGTFDAADYFDFYGSRNYGGLTITYTETNVPSYTTDEYYNMYSDTNAYWVDWGGANGIRFLNSSYPGTTLHTPDYFYDFSHFEKDIFYSIGESYFPTDYRYLSNEKFRGEGWYWTTLGNNQILSDTLSLPLLYTSPQTASIRVFAYPTSRETTILNEHSIEIRVNSTLIGTAYINDINPIDTTISFSSSVLSNSSVNTISLKYVPAQGFSSSVFIDLFELKYPKTFKLRNNKLAAKLNSADTTSGIFKVSGYNASSETNIYDIQNGIRISNYTNNSDTLKFTAKNNSSLVLNNETIIKKPFRIKQKQVPDLLSSSNGADYLLIYNNLFLSQAEQLRAYRQSHDNFRSFKADIEDIYDIFNYGLENPIAVRNFTKYVNDSWQSPKLQYICLMGRGSLDPKRNITSSAYYKNLIPVYGNPNSDGYFANFNIGTFFYNDQIAIGRLPAYSPSEAQTMVDKIIEYETDEPSRWWKSFTYITGGGVLSDQLYHQQRSNTEITNNVYPPPISGEAVKIYRIDDSAAVTFNYADSILNQINRGALFVNYRGHAGSHDWEVAMHDPNTLSNGNRLPLVVSLTCFTGENAKTDFRGFGEKFIYLNNKGAIGFVGTTGWSYTDPGNNFGFYMIQAMKNDTARRIGKLLITAGRTMSRDSLSFSIRHTVNSYNLLGDPAVKLVLPPRPEFVITNTDYKLSNASNIVGEPITLKIFPKNYGLFSDSCKIRFQLKRYNQNYSFHDTVYRNFRYLDTVSYNFKIDSNGVYNMTVTLDQDNWNPLEDKTNNSMTFNVPLNTTSFIPISPVDNAIVYTDSVEFSGLNPNFDFNQKSIKVSMELDTTILFNSPVKRTFVNNNISGTVTKFKTSVPVLNNNTLYFWRSVAILENDTTQWPKVQSFIYNNGGILKSAEKDRYINENISVVLSKRNKNQFSESDFSNTGYANNGVALLKYPANLFVKSYGSNGEEASFFTVGNQNVFIDGGVNTGLNMLKVKKSNGYISGKKNFRMTSASSSDSIVTFLNTFDSTYYLMLLNAAYVPGATSLNASAKSKLRQFGSIYCDSIGLLGYFHTWSLIGYLGAASSQTSEMFDPCCRPAPGCASCDHWTASISSLDVSFTKTEGTLSNIIGPAQIWTDFSWNQTLTPNSSLKFDVFGIDNSGFQTLLFSDITINKFVNLSSVNAYQYPKLNLLAKFNIDTVSGLESSVLNSINVNYTPAAELVLDKNSLQVTSSAKNNSVQNFSFDYHNAGYSYLFGIIVNVYSGANLLLTDTVSSTLKNDSTKNYSNSFTPPSSGDTIVTINIIPKGSYNEFYTFNNSAEIKLTAIAAASIVSSKVEVLSDGKAISNGEYVRKNPEIKINLTDNIPSKISRGLNDTTQVSLKLNDKYIPYFVSGKLNPVLKTVYNKNLNDAPGTGSDVNDVSIFYYPELKSGTNKLSVIYKDAQSGDLKGDNLTSTISYDVIVSDEFLVQDIYNYPNPMKNETSFIFNLAGSVTPENFRIKIYTVSGRLIKEIQYPVNIGYNEILWDGKDNDGDFIANGTYFYKLVTPNESVSGSNNSESQIQKLVVLR